ncbi:MAG: glycosyltransferase [Victivallaceae bacterium]|nr:glycosyltransferase [Victivallaceae bacterium]
MKPLPEAPSVTVVVRSHNDRKLLEELFAMLSRQTIRPLEILCFDNMSADGSRDFLQSCERTVVLDVPQYCAGEVLNRAFERARGDVVAFLNSDATPIDEHCLEELIAPILENKADLVYGCQLPRPEAFPMVRKDYQRAFGDGKIAAGWKHLFFSMVVSAARKEVWEQCPFDSRFRYSEDVEWAQRAVRSGFRLAYAAEAKVLHSHNYTEEGLAKRFRMEGYYDGMLFHDKVSLPRTIAQTIKELIRDTIYLLRHKESSAFFSTVRRRLIQKRSYYQGRRSWEKETEALR